MVSSKEIKILSQEERNFFFKRIIDCVVFDQPHRFYRNDADRSVEKVLSDRRPLKIQLQLTSGAIATRQV